MHDDGGGGLGGLFGGVAIGTAFKARKGKLDACSPKAKTEARVTWTGSGGKVTNVAATAADPKVAKCVERALAGAPSIVSGVCAATVHVGKR